MYSQSINSTEQSQLSILIVDPDPLYNKLCRSLISSFENIQMKAVDNIEDGIAALEEMTPDILIAGYSLELHEQYKELMSACKSHSQRLISFALTEDYGQKIECGILEMGFTSIKHKPINVSRFHMIINHYVTILNSIKHKNACPEQCSKLCYVTQSILNINCEEDITNIGKCVMKFFSTHQMNYDLLDSKCHLLYEIFYSSLNLAEKLQTVFYISENYVACIFNNNDIVEHIVKTSPSYKCLSKHVFFTEKNCAIVFHKAGLMNQTQEKTSCIKDNRCSSEDFFKDIDMENFEDIDLLLEYTDSLFIKIKNLRDMQTRQSYDDLVKTFVNIENKLSFFHDFKPICDSLKHLISVFKKTDFEKDNQNNEFFISMLSTIEEDLNFFINDVFIKKQAADVSFLNDSIFASIMQLSYILDAGVEEITSDIEFF